MMLAVVSPAKSLDYETPAPVSTSSETRFAEQSEIIVKKMRSFSRAKLGELMKISTPLAQLNHERFASWSANPSPENVKQALFAFNGDVYTGLDAGTLNESQINYLQKHLRILSGLYGLLRPLDAMQPYRLEMGTKVGVNRKKNLYEFWGDTIANTLMEDMGTADGVLINLASNEYFKSVNTKVMPQRIIDVEFKDFKNGQYKVLSFFAKKARGMMARYMAVNQLENPDDLKHFNVDGYGFNPELSQVNKWVFTRDTKA